MVIEAIGVNRISGRELRAALAKRGVLKSSPAFYQLMSRLEEAGIVSGENESKMAGGYAIKERFYKITSIGKTVAREALAFYQSASDALARVG